VAALNPRASPTTGAPLHVAITPRAARRLALLMRADGAPALALRVAVSSGGCHGFQYGVSVDSTARLDADEDTLFVYGRPRGEASLGEGLPKVVMDRASLELLDGSSVDYTTELIGSQFKIVDNPRAVSSCGCGTSFDVKTPDRASPWG
jgi:iron-sulfur cluster assembly accessory protein